MVQVKQAAVETVERVKSKASEARSGVIKAGGQARTEVVKLADRISGRAQRRTRARVAVIAFIAIATAAGIAALQLRGNRKHWL